MNEEAMVNAIEGLTKIDVYGIEGDVAISIGGIDGGSFGHLGYCRSTGPESVLLRVKGMRLLKERG